MPIDILMPALSPTMEEGTLAKWLVKEGDTVKSGDVIAEIETDKATMEVEAVDEGTLSKILVPAGTEGVKVNAPIAVLLGEGEKEEEDARPSAAPAPSTKPAKGQAPKEPAPAPAKSNGGQAEGGRIFASPLARRIAAEKGIALERIKGSGPRGRIVKRDVEALAPGAAPAPKPATAQAAKAPMPAAPAAPAGAGALPDPRLFYAPGSFEEVPHDNMRKAIAARLTASMQTTPHYYLTIDCEIDALLHARQVLNAQSPDKTGPFKLSVNDFIVRAVALALMKFPAVNVSWTDTAMLVHKQADIGVAVAIEGGLITPIVRNAETKGLVQISREIAELAEKARNRKLKPFDYEGGSFAVSNLGMFGVKSFTAVINPPHAAILAVGKGEARPVIRDGAIVQATVMTMTLSCDHRAVDGATGGRFLEILKRYIEDPLTMLL